VLEIDAASNNGVDEIRDLREKVKYPPAVAKYKVYIIDEVHMLSTGAFNALLKTLEEPPAHAVFILATTEPQKLPATILSRCQRFDFHRISAENIVDRLMVVLGGIGREAQEDALYEIARAAEGALRDALSLLDMCISRTDGVVTTELVRDALGSVGRAFLFEFTDYLLACDAKSAILKIDEMLSRGLDPQVFVRDVSQHLRGILLAQVAEDAVEELLECAKEDAEGFVRQGKSVPRETVYRLLDLFLQAEPDMKWASSPRTVLELCTARACHPEREADASCIERLHRVEKMLEKGVVAVKTDAVPAPGDDDAPFDVPNAPKKDAPKPGKKPAPEKAPAKKTEQAPAGYQEAVDKLAQENASIRPGLMAMQFKSFEGGVLTVEFPKNRLMFLKLLERRQELLDKTFTESMGQIVRVAIRLEGEGARTVEKPASAAKGVIEQSYDIFGRENIDLTD